MSPNISAASLRYFVVLAEELHFTRAAERLHITPPSLSQQIQRLERQVGLRLFDRAPGRVTLTPAGRELAPLAREATRAHGVIEDWARSAAGEDPAPIKIGLVAGAGLLPARVLSAMVEQESRAVMQIARLGFFDVAPAVRDGEVDIAVALAPIPELDGIQVTPLFSEPRVLVVRHDHPLAVRESITIDETNDLDFVVPTAAYPEAQAWWLVDPRPDGTVPRVVTVADDVEGLMELCAAGIGVNIASASASAQFSRSELRFIPITDIAPAAVVLCEPLVPRHPFTRKISQIARNIAADLATTDLTTTAHARD